MKFHHDYSADYWRFRLPRRKGGKGSLDHADIVEDFWRGYADLLTRQWGVAADGAAAMGKSLYWRMSDSRLHYHTPLHVLSMFSWARRHRIELAPWQELALWFHDAVYKPKSIPGDNEELSAMLARSTLTGFLSRGEVGKVVRGVRATGMHLQRGVAGDVELILDLDVCSFGWNRRNFLASSRALGAELIPIVGEENYRLGRRKFLAALLAKGFVYRTPIFREKFEEIALANIHELLDHEPDFAPPARRKRG